MKRHFRLALIVALVCAACGGGGETAESTTTSDGATSSSSSSSTSSTSSTLFIFNDEPPELNNTGEDFEAILTSLFEYRAWLLANPDPELAPVVFEPGSQLSESAVRILTEDQANDRFTTAPGAEVPSEVRVSERPDEDTVLLFVVRPELGFTVTNDEGDEFEVGEPGADVTAIYELRRSDGAWRLATFTRIDS